MPDLYLNTGHSAGDECSSTYEGRHLTFEESLLVHPTHGDGFVDKGDPVIDAGGQHIVGVSLMSATAATDLISFDTEGIWFLTATASDDDGNSAIQYGDCIYINITTAVLSKIANPGTNRHYGYALGTVAAGTSDVVAIRVHWDPPGGALLDIQEVVAFGDFTDNADTTGYIDLTVQLPIGAVVVASKFVVSTGFTGDTTAVVQAGTAGDLDRFTLNTDQSVLAAATVGSLPATDALDGIGAVATVRVTVTGGADFTSISAGEMTVYIYFHQT